MFALFFNWKMAPLFSFGTCLDGREGGREGGRKGKLNHSWTSLFFPPSLPPSLPPLLPGPLSKSLWANDSLKCPDQWWRHLLYINTVSPWTPSEVGTEGGQEEGREGERDTGVSLINLPAFKT